MVPYQMGSVSPDPHYRHVRSQNAGGKTENAPDSVDNLGPTALREKHSEAGRKEGEEGDALVRAHV